MPAVADECVIWEPALSLSSVYRATLASSRPICCGSHAAASAGVNQTGSGERTRPARKSPRSAVYDVISNRMTREIQRPAAPTGKLTDFAAALSEPYFLIKQTAILTYAALCFTALA
jgi:hypothetical protein